MKQWSLLFLLFAYCGAGLQILVEFFLDMTRGGRSLYTVLIGLAREVATVDIRYLGRLERKSLDALEFVQLQLRAERDHFERRLGLTIGAIEKIGLAPGFLALSVSYSRPSSNTILDIVVTSIAYALPALYIFGAGGHYLMLRMDRAGPASRNL